MHCLERDAIQQRQPGRLLESRPGAAASQEAEYFPLSRILLAGILSPIDRAEILATYERVADVHGRDPLVRVGQMNIVSVAIRYPVPDEDAVRLVYAQCQCDIEPLDGFGARR